MELACITYDCSGMNFASWHGLEAGRLVTEPSSRVAILLTVLITVHHRNYRFERVYMSRKARHSLRILMSVMSQLYQLVGKIVHAVPLPPWQVPSMSL